MPHVSGEFEPTEPVPILQNRYGLQDDLLGATRRDARGSKGALTLRQRNELCFTRNGCEPSRLPLFLGLLDPFLA